VSSEFGNADLLADPKAEGERILLSPPDVGEPERDALLRAFDSGWIAPAGPELAAFETELAVFLDVEACAALSSGSAALHLALIMSGIGPGDEVIVPTSTFAATAFAVVQAGATPVFIDVSAETWCIDLDLLEEELGRRDKSGQPQVAAVMPVDLYGYMPDYFRLETMCSRHGVTVIADAAESLGSSLNGQMAGTFGDLSALSFNGNKVMTTSGGGALAGPTEAVLHARHLATQAREPVHHYEHAEIGFNYRMSNLLAALGRAQLEGLPRRIDRRREIHQSYVESLPQLTWRKVSGSEDPNCWLSVGLLPEGCSSSEVCATLDSAGVEARPFWKPMHQQPVFGNSGCCGSGLVSESLFERGIALPSGSSMSMVDVERVGRAVSLALEVSE
jgi:dTDP-4-amino-4,6-dideoxygalactose transaminase